MGPAFNLFIDFDGTISLGDTTDLILAQFADWQWQVIEAEWVAGCFGSRECLRRQTELIRASPAALDAFAATVEIDAALHAVLAACRVTGTPVTIVSDGFDRVIRNVLARHGIEGIPIVANHLRPVCGDRWELSFPNAVDGCDGGVCKCDVACNRRRFFAFAGDGRSDFCVVGNAAVIFAKAQLADHCRQRGLPFVPFNSLSVVADWLLSIAEYKPSSGDFPWIDPSLLSKQKIVVGV
ncbi:HAD-IB family phosphatase [Boseaceae bacterium BT-24-1]|nr:HAD-IB family phosphatase [Boseaceae bacterium BT-24-1]